MASVQLLQATPPSLSSHKTPLYALDSCSNMAELKQHHSHIIRLGLSSDNDAMGRVIKFCAISESGCLTYALKAFDKMPHPDAFLYNTIIRGFLQSQLTRNCILLYSQMLQDSLSPNKFTFPPVIRACSVSNAVEEGEQVHAHVLKYGLQSDGFSQNNLIHMYVNFQCLEEARRIFDKNPKRDGEGEGDDEEKAGSASAADEGNRGGGEVVIVAAGVVQPWLRTTGGGAAMIVDGLWWCSRG
ncbi:hypothetical protein RJ639_019255 [Escallonia herrerae]|uniref:Pentatricopeptide repeat-containing protein n=1 Tax=Escallonia herrerae TaxID=1293975 RepID=A0AA88V7K1_9ASTE|nr:hypothetical protein RJ639_019255 [Escallonia herrerae]